MNPDTLTPYNVGIALAGLLIVVVVGFLRDPIVDMWTRYQASGANKQPRKEGGRLDRSPNPVLSEKPTHTTAARSLDMIDLATLTRCSTILLVGSRGSGKSTLLRALLSARTDAVTVFDPHAAPGDWPMAAMVHNSESSISTGIASAYEQLQTRKNERRQGVRLSGWPGMTLAADEWGSIVADVELPKEIDLTPGEVSTKLMKEGRKFGIGFVAGAHGFTNKSLGCTGDQDAFMQSFDWVIHMGGYTRKILAKDYADLMEKIPMGTNEQGGTFPLVVVAESPTTGELRLLDMRGLEKMVDIRPRSTVQPASWERQQSGPANALLAGLLGPQPGDMNAIEGDMSSPEEDMRGTASESEGTEGDMGTVPPPTPAEIAYISMSLSQGKGNDAIVKSMKGYNGRTRKTLLGKVEYVRALLPDQVQNEA